MKASAEFINENPDWVEDLLSEDRLAAPAFRGASKVAGAAAALSLVGAVGVGSIDTAAAVPSSEASTSDQQPLTRNRKLARRWPIGTTSK